LERGLGREVHVYPDLAAASSALARHLRARAIGAVRSRGRFSWVLAGGHTPEALYRLLARRYRARFPWGQTEVFFGDERCVPPHDPDSNYAMTEASLLSRVAIPPGHVHRLRGELRPASRAASEYARLLRPPPSRTRGETSVRFDLALLGLGPDGHTASLFPRASALREKRRAVVAVARSAQPPYVPRLTLTLPALASSREVVFLVAGKDKAVAVAGTLQARGSGNARWPASRVRSAGDVRWFLDRAAASALPEGVPTSLRE
jgi:6-phosphogluconolactonase